MSDKLDRGEARAFGPGEQKKFATFLATLGVRIDHYAIPRFIKAEAPCSMVAVRLKEPTVLGAYSFATGAGIYTGASIGRFTSIAPNVTMGLNEHPMGFLSSHPIAYGRGSAFAKDPYFKAMRQEHEFGEPARTTIGNDVWLGEGVFIRRGVTIGDGAIIAARAAVVNDVPPYHIVVGVPARTLRLRFDEKIVEKLFAARWWELDLRSCPPIDFSKVEEAVDIIGAYRESGPKLLTPPVYELRSAADGFTVTRRG